MSFTFTRLAWAVIIATLPLNFLPYLPSVRTCLILAAAALPLLLLRQPWIKWLATGVLLLGWALGHGAWTLAQIDSTTRQPLYAAVRITAVEPGGDWLRVQLLRFSDQWVVLPLYARVKPPPGDRIFCPGQRWQMQLTLRPVHALLNEGGFDRQRFALANHMPLSGRVLAAKVIDQDCSWREGVMRAARNRYAELPWQALISALAFGERAEVSAEINQLLRETGTAHLMAISGMHIALAAAFGWLLVRAGQFLLPASRIGYRLPLLGSLLVALVYCWLSGGNPPALRAMLALTLWSALRLRGICCHGWQVWSLCIALILLADPLTMLSASLWLSALAVAGLLLWYHLFPLPPRFTRGKRWLLLRLLHLQFGMLLLMLPLQAVLFHGVSISALLANLWAVPLVSMLTVPLILLALVFNPIPAFARLLWLGVDRSLALVFTPLQWLPRGWLTLDEALTAASVLCWLLLLSLRFGWWRSSPLTLCSAGLLLCSWRTLQPQPEWRVDMLDVGHGLAVAISRHGHTTLYDTGNRWPGGDMARSQILPWLAWHGLQVDGIILSHVHMDHIGGLESVQQAFPAAEVRSALGWQGHLPCRRGERWQWQGLQFSALWPPQEAKGQGNNQSCVVLVTDGRWRVLLTGDLEAPAERQLVAEQRANLAADLLQVPHHGSRTSSSPPLLRAVAPRVALASAARYSAWRLPARQTLNAYQKNHIAWHDTALSGQLSARFFVDNWQILTLREQIMNRWYHQWFGVPRDSG